MGEETPPETCANCGESRVGRFCHGCGLDSTRVRLSARRIAARLAEEWTTLESGIPGSLKGLATRPGEWIAEYAAGKRAGRVHPLRFFLFAMIAYLLLLRLVDLQGLIDVGMSFAGAPTPDDASAHRISDLMGDAVAFILNYLQVFVLLALPVTAGAMSLLFAKARRTFAEHLAFLLFTYGAVTVVTWFTLPLSRVSFLVWFTADLLIQTMYITWAATGFYGTRWATTVPRTLAIVFVTMAVSQLWATFAIIGFMIWRAL